VEQVQNQSEALLG
jgi:hypothetical protein